MGVLSKLIFAVGAAEMVSGTLVSGCSCVIVVLVVVGADACAGERPVMAKPTAIVTVRTLFCRFFIFRFLLCLRCLY
jgi:hypothetical protein